MQSKQPENRRFVKVGLIAAGIAAAVVFIAGLEVVLRHGGFDVGPEPRDPFAGFSTNRPRFLEGRRPDGTRIYQTRPTRPRRRHWQEEQVRHFPAEKAANAVRIFVLGGSSVAGVPYGVAYSFAGWLEQRLEEVAPQIEWQVVNAGFSGYATRRIAHIAKEIGRHQPDILIVYSGHNEFAEQRYYQHLLDQDPRLFRINRILTKSHIYRWLFPVDSQAPPRFEIDDQNRAFEMFAVMADRASGGVYPSERERAYGALLYEHNLREIVRRAHAANAQTILLTLSQNFSDWPPGASANQPDLSLDALARWQRHYDEGVRLAATECTEALAEFRAALTIDGSHAQLHYETAQCSRELGDYDSARWHYYLASDHDQIPQGAPLSFNEIIRRVAQGESAHVVDIHAVLEGKAENGLIGSNYFVDFLHPNLTAHQVIAHSIVEAIRRSPPRDDILWRDTPTAAPSADELLAKNHWLRVKQHLAMGLACILSLRRDCARDAATEALRIDPESEVAHEYLSILRTSSLWDKQSRLPSDTQEEPDLALQPDP